MHLLMGDEGVKLHAHSLYDADNWLLGINNSPKHIKAAYSLVQYSAVEHDLLVLAHCQDATGLSYARRSACTTALAICILERPSESPVDFIFRYISMISVAGQHS